MFNPFIAAAVVKAKRTARAHDRPVVFLLSPKSSEFHENFESWGARVQRIAELWEDAGAALPAAVVSLEHDLMFWSAEKVAGAFARAGLTAFGREEAEAWIAEMASGPAARQADELVEAMRTDVNDRVRALLGAATVVARYVEETPFRLEVVAVTGDRLVRATGRVSGVAQALPHRWTPSTVTTEASATFLAGQTVTVRADRDGSLDVWTKQHRFTVRGEAAGRVLDAIGAATALTRA